MTIEQAVPHLVALTPDSVDIGHTLRRVIEEILASREDRVQYRSGVAHDVPNNRLAFWGRAPAAISGHPFVQLDQAVQGTLACLHQYYPEAPYRLVPEQPVLTADGVFAKHGMIISFVAAIDMRDILPSGSVVLAGLPATVADKKATMVQISTEVSPHRSDDLNIVHEDEYASLATVTLPAKIRQAVVAVLLQLV